MDKNYNLADLKIGETAEISHNSNNEIPSKIHSMGLVPGVKIILKSKAPFNGPICIGFGENESKIALRKEEARNIYIQKN